MIPVESGEIITFYSYKGGSGRSMALANVACLLADPVRIGNQRVLAIDWDLEAPGLHRFFQGLFTHTDQEVELHPGLIDLFLDLESRTKSFPPSIEAPESSSWASGFGLDSYILQSSITGLDIMKAGRFGTDYARNVTSFDWAGLYSRLPWLFAWFTNQLTERYRYILIDSRTGETDTSSICTSILPEKLVAVFTPNLQAIQGVLRQTERAVRFRRTVADERPIKILPLPSRIENARTALRDRWRFETPIGYQPRFEQLFRDLFEVKNCDLTSYFAEMQVPQSPDYAYGEPIAVREESSHDRFTLSGSYVSLVSRLLDDAEPWETAASGTSRAGERAGSFSSAPALAAAGSAKSSWADADTLVSQVQNAIGALDWLAVSAFCDQVIERVWRNGDLLPARHAEVLMSMLRAAGRFDTARKLGDVLIQAGETSNQVRRAYARSLLESGAIAAAINVVETLIETGVTDVEALADCYGLLGSSHKRILVNMKGATAERMRAVIIRSLENYRKAYSTSVAGAELFGINVVALLLKARRLAIEVTGFDDPLQLAKSILARILSPSRKLTWEFPVAMQAALALGDHSGAAQWLDRFLSSESATRPDSVSSTLDQLTNIWNLSETSPPGNQLLPPLRAQLLRVGGTAGLAESQPVVTLETEIREPLHVTVAWYQTGMLRARNVARIEDDDGRPLGTGFLIHVPDFGGPENVLLITPSHVVSGEGAVPGSLDPSYVVVNFTLLGAKFRCSGVVASSPAHELDYTLLKLEKSAAKIQAYQPASALPAPDSGAKIYLVGHHGGRDLEITGDRLLDYDDRVLHYRAATAAGSSGSPVFNERWQLVGMHHAGRADMPKLHGAGTYQAKEGIRIKPILSSIQSQLPSPMPTGA